MAKQNKNKPMATEEENHKSVTSTGSYMQEARKQAQKNNASKNNTSLPQETPIIHEKK